MVTVLDWLGASTIRRGVTTICDPGGALVLASSTSRRPETFFIVRVVSISPGIVVASMLGVLRSTRCSGSAWTAAM